MKKIEFIGASGVGKSTLFNEVVKRRTPDKPWITPSEARVKSAKAMKYQDFRTAKFRLLLACMKWNFFQKHHPAIANILLQKIDCSHYFIKYDPIIGITLDSIVNNNTIVAHRKGEFIKFYMNLIQTDLLLPEKIAAGQLVVYDDGLFHNSDGIGNEKYSSVGVENDFELFSNILPEGIIYCELSVEENYQRRKRRIAAGRGTMIENDLSDRELWEDCRNAVKVSACTVDFLAKQGIPILKIWMEDDEERNIQLINQFINQII